MTQQAAQPVTLGSIQRDIRRREESAPLRGADYRRFSRQLRELPTANAIRLAILGNVTSDLAVPYLAVNAAREGFQLSCHAGHFAQHFQDLKDEALMAFDPQIIFLILSHELLRPDAMANFAAMDADSRRALAADMASEIEQWVELAERTTPATLILSNFPVPTYASLGLADADSDYGEVDFFYSLNRAVTCLAHEHPRVQLFNLAATMARIGTDAGEDRRLFFIAKSGWTEPLMAEIGRDFVRHLFAATGKARKCLVLDLDNTLWGGVAGEDGPWGIRIGQGDAESEAFLAFQWRVKALKSRGILLAICSKNTPSEIDSLFTERHDMPLLLDDFAARAIGWGGKDDGLMAVAEQLNIGLDALVFVDDNPAEIALVRERLPMVETVHLPPEPALYVSVLDRLPYFEKAHLTAEDVGKTAQYAAAVQRDAARTGMGDERDYLRSLGLQLELRSATLQDLPRVHQLFNKTNQFNTTTRRYSQGELQAFIGDPAYRLDVASLRDRFGDLGMIACMLVERGSAAPWRIDSFLMSCRAMGRGVETAMIDHLKAELLTAHADAATALIAEFIPTPRNGPAAGFYPEQGFKAHGTAAGEIVTFRIDSGTAALRGCDWIERIGENI